MQITFQFSHTSKLLIGVNAALLTSMSEGYNVNSDTGWQYSLVKRMFQPMKCCSAGLTLNVMHFQTCHHKKELIYYHLCRFNRYTYHTVADYMYHASLVEFNQGRACTMHGTCMDSKFAIVRNNEFPLCSIKL